MNKIFTQRELEVFAYLYDGLQMSAELLEYVVEHCVQGGHTSIRYIETVAISWHEKGFATVEQAKAYASGFTKNSFSVMRAFGLTGRNPGETEREMIERWFGEYGFTKEVVLEACNRTMEATHNPSFRYADRILSEWRKAGVHSLNDISVLDEQYKGQKNQKNQKTSRQANNQFLNFEQRNTDYDSLVLNHPLLFHCTLLFFLLNYFKAGGIPKNTADPGTGPPDQYPGGRLRQTGAGRRHEGPGTPEGRSGRFKRAEADPLKGSRISGRLHGASL